MPDAKNAGQSRSFGPNGTLLINGAYANPATKIQIKGKITCQIKNPGLREIVRFLFTSLIIG